MWSNRIRQIEKLDFYAYICEILSVGKNEITLVL